MQQITWKRIKEGFKLYSLKILKTKCDCSETKLNYGLRGANLGNIVNPFASAKKYEKRW